MDKNLKKKILIAAIIASVAIVFVPIYFFVFADINDNNKFTVNNKKIVEIIDGDGSFDADDSAGNDSSPSNLRVRTFDDITYTVQYTLNEKPGQTTTGNIEGREVQVEVLIPTTYEATLYYDEENMINMDDRQPSKEYDGNAYYYGTFNVPVSGLGTTSEFNFSLLNVRTTNINTSNSIKPLVFIRETTDEATPEVASVSTLPGDIGCELSTTVTDPDTNETSTTTSNVCDVTITGVENYFVNVYAGTKKTDESTNVTTVPIGLLLGLRNQSGKGIKGSIIPSELTFTITTSDANKLSFNGNEVLDYTAQAKESYGINIGAEALPVMEHGTTVASVNGNTLTVTINNIEDYMLTADGNINGSYFASKYFLTTLAQRGEYDYTDVTVTLTSSVNDSYNQVSTAQVVDAYNYVVGNYYSNIDIYESSLLTGESEAPLDYGMANINYGADFTLKTNFNYASRQDTTGDGLTSLTNYLKIDNDVFKLHNDVDNNSYRFSTPETLSPSSIVIGTDSNSHPDVVFGFGEWSSDYFSATGAAGCPTIDFSNKEQLMNLYGGPCLVANGTVQWAYSPVAENDINGIPVNTVLKNKGPLVVKSTYVAQGTTYILPSSAGTFEVYGSISEDHNVANSTHQVVTSATAYGENNTDFRYLGTEAISGETLLTNPNNFVKTNYDFVGRNLVSLNDNLCSYYKCPVSGTTVLISGIKITKPVITSHKAIDLNTSVTRFYSYPLALSIDANAVKSDDELNFDTAYIDLYLPSYMIVMDNYGVDNAKVPTSVEDTTLSAIYSNLGLGTPAVDVAYKKYHYETTYETAGLTDEEKENLRNGIISNFTIYGDIDPINTPNASTPEVFATVDFTAVKHISGNNGEVTTVEFRPITSEIDRTREKDDIVLYNASSIITRGESTPKYIEKNGSYTFNMLAYNHSRTIVDDGYVYPTADLYYVLPYDGDVSIESGSRIGTTKYTVNFTTESIDSITDQSDYKFYYATTGTPDTIISDESKTTSDPSAIWNLWEDPTTPIANVIAIKVVKQSPFGLDQYFGSSSGLTVNVETVGSKDGNAFYNTFHILATKPDNYECVDEEDEEDEEGSSGYCDEMRQTKANYSSSTSVTSIYSREISGFVFEDSDYNGIYTVDESRIKDISVSLYKVAEVPSTYDPLDPTSYVRDGDALVASTITGENGNYYFGGLAPGNYYVSYTFDNDRYVIADLGKTSDLIPDSANNNSKVLLLPNTNKAVSAIITFTEDTSGGKNIVGGVNMGLAIKKEMAIELSKYITEVTVAKNGKVDKYDYSDQKLSQVSVTVLNPKDTKITVKYVFSIENTKYYPGYVGMIVDSMPKDMTFNPDLEENKDWIMYDNLIYYNGLAGKLLLPNEKQYFTLVLDLNLKEAGTYRNIVSAKDLTLMGNELPIYDFDSLNSTPSNGGNETVITPVDDNTPDPNGQYEGGDGWFVGEDEDDEGGE